MTSCIEKKYFPEVDILKGFAILLVIFGHAPQMCGEVNSLLYYTIISPQMVMFFIASGFLFIENDSWSSFFHKKVARLLIPYCSFWLILVLLHLLFEPFTATGNFSFKYISEGFITGKHYWFLWILLWIMITVRLFSFRYGKVVLIVLSVMSVLLFKDIPLNLWRYLFYLFPFILGIFIRKIYHNTHELVLNYRYFLICLSAIIFYSIYFINRHSVIDDIMGRFSSTILFTSISINLATKYPKLGGILVYFGRYSLQYYLIHILIMAPLCRIVDKLLGQFLCPNFQWIVNFVLALILSYIGLYILKSTKVTRYISGLK